MATEPVSIEEVALECFGEPFMNHVVEKPARYDMRTIHSGALGGADGYLLNRAEVKESMRQWIDAERARRE